MPTDRQPTEQEMAREALGLLIGWVRAQADRNEEAGHAVFDFVVRAADILDCHGPCPGFWGEVLAAVRVLADWPVCAIAQPKIDGHFWTLTLPWTDTPKTITADTEPAAILAALRAVVGAA